ncbi:hypothetical protein PENTCL1PPCAC_4901, partial [Pristionchus entomophagus]
VLLIYPLFKVHLNAGGPIVDIIDVMDRCNKHADIDKFIEESRRAIASDGGEMKHWDKIMESMIKHLYMVSSVWKRGGVM